MISRRTALQAPLAIYAAEKTPALASETIPSLRHLAGLRGLPVGTAVARYELAECTGLPALVARQASIIVPGLELKWNSVQPGPDCFSFDDADAMMRLAARNGQAVRGVHLVWHGALPEWFAAATASPAAMRDQLELHISTLVDRYKGRIQSWDVVNEPVEPYDGRPDGLRNTPFLAELGEEYIDIAFNTAAAHDPGARLVLNEYGLEMLSDVQTRRREAVLLLLQRLVARKVPVHALGIQAHLTAEEAPFSPAVFLDFVNAVAGLGLDVYVTEMDVADRLLPADTEIRDNGVSAVYSQFLTTALSNKAVKMVVFWGMTDRFSWMNDSIWARRPDGLKVRAHPFDADLRPKPAFMAIVNAVTSTRVS